MRDDDGFRLREQLKSMPRYPMVPLGASSYFLKPAGFEALECLLKLLYEVWLLAKIPAVDATGDSSTRTVRANWDRDFRRFRACRWCCGSIGRQSSGESHAHALRPPPGPAPLRRISVASAARERLVADTSHAPHVTVERCESTLVSAGRSGYRERSKRTKPSAGQTGRVQ